MSEKHLTVKEWNTLACYKNIQFRLLEVLDIDKNISFEKFIKSGLNKQDIECLTNMYGKKEALRQCRSVFKSVKETGEL